MTVQVTTGMRTARDLRSMLMDAAYSLRGSDKQTFLCLLFKSGFTTRRLVQEVERFRTVVREDLGSRVHVRALNSPSDLSHALPRNNHDSEMKELQARVAEALSDKPKTLSRLEVVEARLADARFDNPMHSLQMNALEARVAEALSDKPKTSSREAVVGTLLHRWINRLPPVRVPELAVLSGASIPTVYAALKTIDPSCLHRDDDRRLSLEGFSAEAWQKWLSISTDGPSAKFVDRSGSPRSPEKLARQLVKLGRQDVAIGGVLGAKHHLPGLDITAAPHLDVVVHGTQHTDLAFIEKLDPGLVRDDSMDAHGHVIVHFVNRPNSLFEMQDGVVWADVLDCMVNLWDAHLVHQVEDLINQIAPGGLRAGIKD